MIKVLELYDVRRKAGEVGIELEMEGHNLPQPTTNNWDMVGDGSLRDGVEYVLHNPCARVNVKARLNEMVEAYHSNPDIALDPSIRTSTHVHVNVQELNMNQVYNFIILYLIFEDALVKWCGGHREGNLFCLRAQDAEYLLDTLEMVAQTEYWHKLCSDRLRYASLNVSALGKYGSLEFRSMRGTTDMSEVETWVKVLLKLKDAALTYDKPSTIVQGYSEGGEEWFAEQVLGELTGTFCSYDGWKKDLYRGVRRSQSIAYAGEWNPRAKAKPVKKTKRKTEDGQLIDGYSQRQLHDEARRSGVQYIPNRIVRGSGMARSLVRHLEERGVARYDEVNEVNDVEVDRPAGEQQGFRVPRRAEWISVEHGAAVIGGGGGNAGGNGGGGADRQVVGGFDQAALARLQARHALNFANIPRDEEEG